MFYYSFVYTLDLNWGFSLLSAFHTYLNIQLFKSINLSADLKDRLNQMNQMNVIKLKHIN